MSIKYVLNPFTGVPEPQEIGTGGPPTGPAGGDLSGTYPNPTVVAIEETSGPTRLAIGAIADGQLLARSGATVIGVTPNAPEFFLGAGWGILSLTNGANSIQQIEAGTNKINYVVMNFLQGVQSFSEWSDVVMPADYDATKPLHYVAYWLTANGTLNTVAWTLQARGYTDGQAIDQAYGAAVQVIDTNTGAGDINISALSGDLTPGGSPGAGCYMQFRGSRDGTGSLAATAQLLGFLVKYSRL